MTGLSRLQCNLFRLALTIWLCWGSATAVAADWQWRSPLPQGNRVASITYGLERYVAVGDAGTLMMSSDGATWRKLATPTKASLHAVAYGNGAFVAVGDGGVVVRSIDGDHWETAASSVSQTLWRVVHGAGGFVATGDVTLIASPDGAEWMEIDPGIPAGGPFPALLRGLAYGNGRYVSIVDNGPFDLVPPARVLSSSDAVHWRLDDFIAPQGFPQNMAVFSRGLVFGEGFFVGAALQVGSTAITFRSADGITWEWYEMPFLRTSTGATTSLNMTTMAYDAARGRFVGLASPNDPAPQVSDGYVLVESADGAAWTVQGVRIGTTQIHALNFAHDRLFGSNAVGEIYSSQEGADWTPTTPIAPLWGISDMATSGAGMLAAGAAPSSVFAAAYPTEGVVLHSRDGVSWNTVTMPTVAGRTFRSPLAVAASSTTFVIAAGESVRGFNVLQNVLYISNDGVAWRRVELNLEKHTSLISAGYGAGAFLVTGIEENNGKFVLRSLDDGLTWQRTAVTTPLPRMIVHGNRGFLGLGEYQNDELLRSIDGVTWTSYRPWSQPGVTIQSIAYSGGVFVAVAETMEMGARANWLLRSSDDGTTWDVKRFDSTISGLSGTPFGFVIGASSGDIFTSDDGESWIASWSGATRPTKAIADARGRIWVATSNGGILQRSGPDGFADLALTTTAVPAHVRPGETMSFHARLTNGGPQQAAYLGMGFALNAEVPDLAVHGPAGWGCQAPTLENGVTSIACSADSMPVETHAEFVATATAPTTTTSKLVELVAVATSQVEEPTPADNIAGASTVVGLEADLSIGIAGPAMVERGMTAIYNVAVRNLGPDKAPQAVVLIDADLPSASVAAAGSSAGWLCIRESTPLFSARCTATDRAFDAGARSIKVAVLLAKAGDPRNPTPFTISAEVSSAAYDRNSSNNTASIAVGLGRAAIETSRRAERSRH